MMFKFKSKESWFTDVRIGEDAPCGGTIKHKYFCSSVKGRGYIIYSSSDDEIFYYKSKKFKEANENLSKMVVERSHVNILKSKYCTDDTRDLVNSLQAMFLNEVINGRFDSARDIVKQIEKFLVGDSE